MHFSDSYNDFFCSIDCTSEPLKAINHLLAQNSDTGFKIFFFNLHFILYLSFIQVVLSRSSLQCQGLNVLCRWKVRFWHDFVTPEDRSLRYTRYYDTPDKDARLISELL